jgi:hypothetical protein
MDRVGRAFGVGTSVLATLVSFKRNGQQGARKGGGRHDKEHGKSRLDDNKADLCRLGWHLSPSRLSPSRRREAGVREDR